PNANNPLTVSGGNLNVPILHGDFIANDPKASNTIYQAMPEGKWTATTKLNIAQINANGEQAGLAIIKSENPPGPNNTYGKMNFIQTNSGARGFEFIVTQSGSVNPPIANSFTALPEGVPN